MDLLCGYKVGPITINHSDQQAKVSFSIDNEPLVAILNFRFSPNSFLDIVSPILTLVASFKRIRQHFQLVERERERSTDVDAVAKQRLTKP